MGAAAEGGPHVSLTHTLQPAIQDHERNAIEIGAEVTLLREDGSGQQYTRPGKGNADRFLRLPHAFTVRRVAAFR